jgi:hypothetical protein
MTTEAAVRDTLRQEVKSRLDVTGTIDEFWVPRTNERADLAAIGSFLWGFEIKTGRDTLRRLPRQVEAYNRLFDWCAIVVAERHLEAALAVVPPWWGATVILDHEMRISFRLIRQPRPNPGVDPETLVRLLWREEARAILSSLGLDPGASASRVAMWRELLTVCDLDGLKTVVRAALLTRDPWRSSFPARRPGAEGVRH